MQQLVHQGVPSPSRVAGPIYGTFVCALQKWNVFQKKITYFTKTFRPPPYLNLPHRKELVKQKIVERGQLNSKFLNESIMQRLVLR